MKNRIIVSTLLVCSIVVASIGHGAELIEAGTEARYYLNVDLVVAG